MVVLLVLVVAGVIALVISHDREKKGLAADQARFTQADNDLLQIKDTISQNVVPESLRSDNYCQRVSNTNEFGSKPIICNVTLELIYSFEDNNKATKTAEEILHTINAQGSWTLIKSSKTDSNDSETLLYNDKKSGILCTVDYIIYPSSVPPMGTPRFSFKSSIGLVLHADCNGEVRHSLYKISA
jgi:hypothetical protein